MDMKQTDYYTLVSHRPGRLFVHFIPFHPIPFLLLVLLVSLTPLLLAIYFPKLYDISGFRQPMAIIPDQPEANGFCAVSGMFKKKFPPHHPLHLFPAGLPTLVLY